MAADNKEVVRRWYKAFENGDMTVVEETVDPSMVDHSSPPGMPGGVEGSKALIGFYRSAFPNISFTMDDLIAEGDKVVARWTSTGTHTGPLMSLPPTGQDVTVQGISIFRIVNGKIAEQWYVLDQLGMLQQMGVVPAMG